MRALKPIREIRVRSRLNGSFERLLAQLSATTLELNPSLGKTELVRRLAARATEMLGARACVLALRQGSDWEIAAISGPAHRWGRAVQRRLASTLGEQAAPLAVGLRSGTSAMILGRELAESLGWRQVVLARLMGSEDRPLGVLCVADLGRDLSPVESQILEALASHAAVAIENVRLFSRVELSRKRWVEDFDAITDLIVVHDNANKVLRLNRALAEALGIRLTEAIGQQIGKLEMLKEPAEPGQCPFCRNLAVEHEEFILNADARTYLVSASRIKSSGDEARTIHVLKDITDRREAERRYRRERDFNHNILNNTHSMILVLDIAGHITYANRRCFQVGYGEENLVGRPFSNLVASASRPSFGRALEKALAGASVDNLEISVVRRDGVAGQFSLSLSPMKEDQGEITSVVVVMTDVTDAASLQAKLVHTEKMAALGQLVSGVAHEVNNPLAAIVGFTDLLLENPEVPDDAKHELAVILQEAQRTRVIVQNLLRFARQMPAQREPVQINTLLQRTLKLRAYDFSNHGIELFENYDKDLPLTTADPHQLQQVFLNILNNAYDAVQEAKRPGRIELTTSHRDGHIEIAISDNGTGISQPERIFDPFFTTKEVGKGTGLGLSICYGIVRAHDGEISAHNNLAGAGCTFVVQLPIAPKLAELAATEAVL
jgi:two-component system, NtrC family, sensor kinase